MANKQQTLEQVIARNVEAFASLEILSGDAALAGGTEPQRRVAALIRALADGDDAMIRRLSKQAVVGNKKGAK